MQVSNPQIKIVIFISIIRVNTKHDRVSYHHFKLHIISVLMARLALVELHSIKPLEACTLTVMFMKQLVKVLKHFSVILMIVY